MRYLARPHDSPGQHTVHYAHTTNSFTGNRSVSKPRTDSDYTNYSSKWHQLSKIRMFSLCCVRVWSCPNLPDTFIEDVEFVIRQTFLLEDCYDSVVDAETQPPTWTGPHYCLNYIYFLHLDCIWCTCSRWHWLPPSSAFPPCPLVNFSHSSPARWGWESSSTSAGAESSWGR